jgi:signal transduction histidine kinase
VEDDGRGMADSKIDGGLGIDGLRRSADLLEGSLEIEDVPTGGTAIIVSFPND